MLHMNQNVANSASNGDKNKHLSEKMTQAGDGNVWQVTPVEYYYELYDFRTRP